MFSILLINLNSPTLQKIRVWYGNHTRDCVRGTDNRSVLDLSGKAHRRPLRLQRAQAYSILYYVKGTPLFQEINTLYDNYKAGDAATVAELRPLLDKTLDSESPPPPTPADPENSTATSQTDATEPQATTVTPPSKGASVPKKSKRRKQTKARPTPSATHHVPKFVVFQQALFQERIKGMSEVEAAAVDELIEETYATALKIWESPWLSMKKGQEEVPENELENLFYQRYGPPQILCDPGLIFCSNIDRLGHSVQVAIEEISRHTTHKTFFMCGGPSPVAGTLDSVTYVHVAIFLTVCN